MSYSLPRLKIFSMFLGLSIGMSAASGVKVDEGIIGWDDFPPPIQKNIAKYTAPGTLFELTLVSKNARKAAMEYMALRFEYPKNLQDFLNHIATRVYELPLPVALRLGLQYNDASLITPYLTLFSALQEIQIYHPVHSQDFAALSDFVDQNASTLEKLVVYPDIMPGGWEYEVFPKLNALKTNIGTLNQIPQSLETLSMTGSRPMDFDFAAFTSLIAASNITTLTFFNISLEKGDLPFLFGLPKLKELTLSRSSNDFSCENNETLFTAIQKNNTLQALNLEGIGINMGIGISITLDSHFFEALEQIPTFKKFTFSTVNAGAERTTGAFVFSAENLNFFSRLKEVDLSAGQINKQDLPILFNSKTLHTLSLNIPNQRLDTTHPALRSNQTLRNIHINIEGAPQIMDKSFLKSFFQNPTLKTVSLGYTYPLSRDVLKEINQNKTLTSVNISQNSVARGDEIFLQDLILKDVLTFFGN